jgi:hypothetical protein
VNASRRPSRDAAHHSGSGRMASPYPMGDFHLLFFASFPGALRFGSSLCENSLEPGTRRIVFSIAFSQEKSPVQSVSTTTKLRQKFYRQVQRRSFHTAWVKTGKSQTEQKFSLPSPSGGSGDLVPGRPSSTCSRSNSISACASLYAGELPDIETQIG